MGVLAKLQQQGLNPLARRQAVQVGVVAIGLLLLSGLVEMWFSYQEARQQVATLQRAQAQAAARDIGQLLGRLESGLRDMAKLPWGRAGFDRERLGQELWRLMVLHPVLTEVQSRDAQGELRVQVSRHQPPQFGPGRLPLVAADVQAFVPGQVRYGQPFFDPNHEPVVAMLLAEHPQAQAPATGQMVATVRLRLVADALIRLEGLEGWRAWLVDDQNRLILHPVQTEMLRQRNLSHKTQVQAARQALRLGQPMPVAQEAWDVAGKPVLTTAVTLAETGWLLFLEQPRSVVLAPALATLERTGWLVLLAAVLAALASAWQGQRLAQPIVALRQASGRIAQGDFSTPVVLNQGHELDALAADLNTMAQRLQSFYQELEAQVMQRTEELRQARDVAERASQAKTRFLAAASHDLRQPMHTIGLLTAVLQSRLDNPQTKMLADKLQLSVEVMERLFGSLLDISKLDAGAVAPQWEVFAVQDMFERLRLRFEPQAQDKGLVLRVHSRAVRVRSDPVLLERCMANLLSNAIRYCPHGGVLLGCRRRSGQLWLEVYDTGVGIAPEHQSLVFEEFVRLPGAEQATSKGLGLGLAIVQRSAMLLNHPLRLRSQPGRGSVFGLAVPGVWPQLPAAVADQRPHPQLTAAPLQGVLVWLLDDDDDNRHALQALCEGWGCHVVAAASVEQGVQLLDDALRWPDVLLTDWQLGPGRTGLDWVQQVWQTTESRIPAVLITANTDAHTAASAQALAVPMLHKPVGAERLLAAMREVCQRPPP